MRAAILLSAALALTGPTAVRAADFYEGKTVTIVVGYSPGGTYDQIARFYARELPRFLAGHPNVVVQNKPGAGSLVAMSYLYNSVPHDGTVLGIVGGGTVLEPILGNPQARYDSRKFGYIVGTSGDDFMCTVWHTTPVNNIDDVKKREVVVGATGTGSRLMSFPYALNQLIGTKFKVVTGYPGGNDVSLAMEKGEIEGYCGWAISSIRQRAKAWLDDKKIRFLTQFALKKNPDYPDVPLAMDLPPTETGKRAIEFLTSDAILAWPLLAPPDLPAERVTELRRAFDTMLKDPQVLADAAKEGLIIDPISGEEMARFVEHLYTTPADVVDIVKKIQGTP